MIYQCVVGPCNNEYRFNEDASSIGYIIHMEGIQALGRDDHLFNHQCFDSSICGAVVARDMAHASYPRRVILDPEYGNKTNFIADDRWGVGLRPIDFIHRLEVRINEYSLSPYNKNRSHVLSTLDALSLLQRGTEIEVALEIYPLDNPCLHCKCDRGLGYDCLMIQSVCGRSSEDAARFYQDIKPFCEVLHHLQHLGLKVGLMIEDVEWRYACYYTGYDLSFSAVKDKIAEQRRVSFELHDKNTGSHHTATRRRGCRLLLLS